MKKIKTLNILLIIIVLYGIFISLFNTYIVIDTYDWSKNKYEFSILGIYKPFIDLVFSILFWTGVFFIQQGISNVLKKGIFNKKSNQQLKKAGLFLMISGLFSFIIGLEFFFNIQGLIIDNKIDHFFMRFPGNDFLIVLVGLTFYFISDIINEGSTLKQENDLTI